MLSLSTGLSVLAAAISLIAVILFIYLRWHFNYWVKRNVPGPKPQLLLGTFPKTSRGECNLMEELNEIYLQYKHKHRYVGVFTARSPKLFILDPQLATQILTQNFKNFHDNESSQWTTPKLDPMRFCSPFVSTGEAWKEMRGIMVPSVSPSRISKFSNSLLECAQGLRKFLDNKLGEPLDAKETASRFSTEFMANYIWGVEGQSYDHPDSLSIINQMANDLATQAVASVRYYSRTAAFPWVRKFRPERFSPAHVDRFFMDLVSNVMRRGQVTERHDVINHLLQLKDKKSLSDVQITGHTLTMLIDGFETASSIIAHCLLLLARYPRVQSKLREELRSAQNPMSYEELNALPYLEQCLQESLRIFPPLANLFKLCTESITLSGSENSADVTLHPGDVVYISTYSFHHDPEYFQQPEEFWPERFDEQLGGVRKYRDMGVFAPFGDGPRMCPGMKLGLAEAKVAVAEVIRDLEVKAAEGTRLDNKLAPDSFILCSDGTIRLIFEKVE